MNHTHSSASRQQSGSPRPIFNLMVPANQKWDPNLAHQFIAGLFALPGTLELQIQASAPKIAWRVVVAPRQAEAFQRLFYSYFPRGVIFTGQALPQPSHVVMIQSSTPHYAPLKYGAEFPAIDPLSILVSAISKLSADEQVTVALTLEPIRPDIQKLGQKAIRTSSITWTQSLTLGSAMYAVNQWMFGSRQKDRFVPDMQRMMDTKLRAPLKETYLRIEIRASTPTRMNQLVRLLTPAWAQFTRDGFNELTIASQDTYPLVLCPQEVAALWHLPSAQCRSQKIQWIRAQHSPLPIVLQDNANGIRLGSNLFQGEQQTVTLPYADRITHINIIGRTAVGKSTLMHHMIHQDIANGKGVGVIDPHGKLIQQILECSIQEGREEDVVLFDLSDTEFPIGLNLLVNQEGVAPEETASHALEVIRKMFADNWHTGRMETALYSALITLMNVSGAAPTLMDITRLFHDSDVRAELLTEDTDSAALEFWIDQYNPAKPAYQSQIASPITNRLNKFYRNPGIRNVICQPNSLDFADILEKKRIFLACLGGVPKIETEVIGALLVSKFQMAAMSHARLQAHPEPYHLHIDEVQYFVTTSLPEMLSEARKFGLSLVVANQYLQQLEGDTLSAVMGNTGTNIIFRIGSEDAAKMAPHVKPDFSREDLFNLSRFNAIVKMQVDGETLPAFNMHTDKPRMNNVNATAQIEWIRNHSRATYAHPKAEVQKEIAQRIFRNSKSNQRNSQANGEESYLG